jgi:hypothetical protein
VCCYTHDYGDSTEESYFKYYDKSKYNRFYCFRALVFKGGFCNDYDKETNTYKLGNDVQFYYSFSNGIDERRVWEIAKKVAKKVAKKYNHTFVGGLYSTGTAYLYA